MRRFLLTSCSFLVAVVGLVSATLSATDKSNINNGLTAAKALSDFIEQGNFTTTLTQLTKTVGPYLSAIGPIVGFIVGLFGQQESAELTFMRKMMKQIDNRFDRLDGKFADVNRKIDYVHIQIQFGIIEQKIIALSSQFQTLYNVPSAAAKHQKDIFIANYESDFQNSAAKLYDGIMNEKGVFSQSLGEAAMKYTQNDRGATQQFLMGVLKLLLQGVKIELAYLKAKGYNANYDYSKRDWEQKIGKVRSKMAAIDRTVASKYHTQADSDINRFAVDHSNLNHHDFSTALYKFLSSKYFWRDWMVLIYKDITGSDKHYVHECNGFIKFRNNGRNIVIASVDKRTPLTSRSAAQSILSRTVVKTEYHRHGGKRDNRDLQKRYFRKKSAQDIYNSYPSSARAHCSPYAAIGVVDIGADAQYQGPSNRLVHITKDYYTLFIFG